LILAVAGFAVGLVILRAGSLVKGCRADALGVSAAAGWPIADLGKFAVLIASIAVVVDILLVVNIVVGDVFPAFVKTLFIGCAELVTAAAAQKIYFRIGRCADTDDEQ
jgi:hypothetical protein